MIVTIVYFLYTPLKFGAHAPYAFFYCVSIIIIICIIKTTLWYKRAVF
jgi:heme/copper-type cytochrome/quinol oxidase subunit 4